MFILILMFICTLNFSKKKRALDEVAGNYKYTGWSLTSLFMHIYWWVYMEQVVELVISEHEKKVRIL